jgi:hypothetical protein
MFSSLGIDAIGVLCLVLFGLFYWLSIFATFRAILAFVGTCLLGTVGFLGGALHAVVLWLVSILDNLGAWAFGVAAIGGLIATVVSGIIFAHDLHPKKTAGKRTGWAAIAFAALLVAGVSGIPALDNLPATVQQGVTNARTVVNGG